MNEDKNDALKIWTKPEVIDVDASSESIESGVGTLPDAFAGTSS